MRTTLLHWLFLVHLARGTEFTGHTYSVQELNQEFPVGGDPANYAPWAQDSHPSPYLSGGGYLEYERPQVTYSSNENPSHYIPQTLNGGHVYQEPIPSIHTYRPTFTGKDYNEYPHILPPGGKTIEQLQQEADLRVKKIFFDSRENQKLVGEKIKKLKDTYGYGTIGYPGYRNTIKYEPIDLGTHNAIDLGSTLEGSNGNLRLPVQTVTVTKTLGVRVPQPYPVRQEIPIPAPFPVPVREPHVDDENIHGNREVKQYLGAFAGEFSDKSHFTNSDSSLRKGFRYSRSKHEKNVSASTTTPSTTIKTYTGFRPPFGIYASLRSPTVSPRSVYQF